MTECLHLIFLSQFGNLQPFTIIIIYNIFQRIITISFCFLFNMSFFIFYFSLSAFYWWKFSLVYFYLFSYFKSNTQYSSLRQKCLILLRVYHILFHSFLIFIILCHSHSLVSISLLVCTDEGASQVALVVKNPLVNAGDIRDRNFIPVSGRSPGGGHGSPLQYSYLENPHYRGAWQATVHGVTKNWTRLKRFCTDKDFTTI